MRSDLVFSALGSAPGRYRLCRLTAKAGRELHTRKNRIQDTLNDVLMLLSNSTMPGDDGSIAGEKTTSGCRITPRSRFADQRFNGPRIAVTLVEGDLIWQEVSAGDRTV